MAEKQRFTVVEEVLWTVDAVGTAEALALVRDGITPDKSLEAAHYEASVTDRWADDQDEVELAEVPVNLKGAAAMAAVGGELERHEVFERCEWTVDAESAEAAFVLVRDGIGVSKELEDAHFEAAVEERYVEGYPDVGDDTVEEYEMGVLGPHHYEPVLAQ